MSLATELQDGDEMMARISGGDLIAIEAKYHLIAYLCIKVLNTEDG